MMNVDECTSFRNLMGKILVLKGIIGYSDYLLEIRILNSLIPIEYSFFYLKPYISLVAIAIFCLFSLHNGYLTKGFIWF